MSLLALSLLALGQTGTFQDAIDLAQKSRFKEAHQIAQAIENPLERSQASVYVRLRAGDLVGAYKAADRGVRENPKDLWLSERRASISLSLGEFESATTSLTALSDAVAQTELAAADREAWQTTLDNFGVELTKLGDAKVQRERSTLQARALAIAGVASLLIACFVLGYWKAGASGSAPEST